MSNSDPIVIVGGSLTAARAIEAIRESDHETPIVLVGKENRLPYERPPLSKGVMLGNVPNFAFCVGYTNASWTLRADLSSAFVCRLLNHMDQHGYRVSRPECDESTMDASPLLRLTSGYVQRSVDAFPKQAGKAPWLLRQNYVLDLMTMRYGAVDDGTIHFAKGERKLAARATTAKAA